MMPPRFDTRPRRRGSRADTPWRIAAEPSHPTARLCSDLSDGRFVPVSLTFDVVPKRIATMILSGLGVTWVLCAQNRLFHTERIRAWPNRGPDVIVLES